MEFLIKTEEIAALAGLPHIQQLAYLRGIRPYMDVKTAIVGIKRGISYQSIAEQLYVEPHQGIKSESFSRDQVRRAVAGLVRAGLISVHSEDKQLILKCELAKKDYFVQNKAAINPPQKATTNPPEVNLVDTGFSGVTDDKADIEEGSKAAIPLYNNNYIYLLSAKFEKFWSVYPEKKSKSSAWMAFQQVNPDELLFNKIMQALEAQKNHIEALQVTGAWTPPWKHPANWLAKQCWEDELTVLAKKEKTNAHGQNRRVESSKDMFSPDAFGEECEDDFTNVISLR